MTKETEIRPFNGALAHFWDQIEVKTPADLAAMKRITSEYEALKSCANALQRIYKANESGNNGSVMGEAVLCRQFSAQANEALNQLDNSENA